MYDFTKSPYFLEEDTIRIITNKVANMSISEKIGQLFFTIGIEGDKQEIATYIDKYKPGGMMFRPGLASVLAENIRHIQNASDIPLFIAANLESGGNGIIKEGTWVGTPMQIAATGDSELAYQLGNISGREAQLVGCNMSFSPIVDIDYNFRNPITNTRTFGSNPEIVLAFASKQIKGLREQGMIPVIKHFPGDGVDDRDQHLLSSVNTLDTDSWLATYGHIYQSLIDEDVPSIMIGHIFQPAWEKALDPELSDADLKPASASKVLVNQLLRAQLGFNGLAITDATAMIGYNVIMPRQDLLVETINAGVDMLLFNKNIDEDYEAIRTAIADGRLGIERLDEAVSRILATKYAQGLFKKDDAHMPLDCALPIEKHQAIVKEIAKKSVTLVKDREHILPISPLKTKRIRLVILGDSDEGGFKEGGQVAALFEMKLQELGFEVSRFQLDMHEIFVEGVADLKAKFDLAIYVANVETASNQTTTRLNWIQLMAANAPWFACSIPTVFISTANPYHLYDVPYISTYINAYTGNKESVEAVLYKMTGKEAFFGISPVDPFCGSFQAKL